MNANLSTNHVLNFEDKIYCLTIDDAQGSTITIIEGDKIVDKREFNDQSQIYDI